MSNLQRCETCVGRKQILSLGGLMKDCRDCHGVGWIEPKEEVKVEDCKNANGEPVKVRKKPGRKPKEIQKDMFVS